MPLRNGDGDFEEGHELDVLVAEKVMGWKIFNLEDHRGDHEWLDNPANYPHCMVPDGGGGLLIWRAPRHDGDYWRPSRDIAAAWEVVEKMIRRTERWVTVEYVPGDSWRCTITDDAGGRWEVEKAYPAAVAICRAALKCVGVE